MTVEDNTILILINLGRDGNHIYKIEEFKLGHLNSCPEVEDS